MIKINFLGFTLWLVCGLMGVGCALFLMMGRNACCSGKCAYARYRYQEGDTTFSDYFPKEVKHPIYDTLSIELYNATSRNDGAMIVGESVVPFGRLNFCATNLLQSLGFDMELVDSQFIRVGKHGEDSSVVVEIRTNGEIVINANNSERLGVSFKIKPDREAVSLPISDDRLRAMLGMPDVSGVSNGVL